MEVVADPQIVGIAVLGRDGVDILRMVGREIRGVALQQRAADTPDDVALRALLLRADALHEDARTGRDRLDRDAGLLGEGREDELVEHALIGVVDHHARVGGPRRAGRRDGEQQCRTANRAGDRRRAEFPHVVLPRKLCES